MKPGEAILVYCAQDGELIIYNGHATSIDMRRDVETLHTIGQPAPIYMDTGRVELSVILAVKEMKFGVKDLDQYKDRDTDEPQPHRS